MIYFCADDYGLNNISSHRILQCIDKGVLNKVSVFPNFDKVDLSDIPEGIRLSLHLNLVEGKCMSNADELDLIAASDGRLKHTFGGLFLTSLIHRKRLEAQLYKEIRAQVLYWKSILPDGKPFCIDSHQHTHMIPAVFNSLMRVLDDEKIEIEYIRVPAEPLMPFIKIPSLYFSYSAVNIIKQWLLKLLWLVNKGKRKVPTAYFFGILFSGRMDEKRVSRVLPHYVKMAQNKGVDVEVLFHPGYLEKNEADFKNKSVVFESFYFSENRKTEFDSVTKIAERSEL